MNDKTRSGRRRTLGEAGQAAVELALALPIFLLLMVGILEFARAWNLHQVMTDAVREGGRRAALADGFPWDSTEKAMWERLDQFGYHPAYATMAVTPADSFKRSGAYVTIAMSLPYRFWILPGKQITMKSSFTVRNE